MPGAVIGRVGHPGSGKTYSLVHAAFMLRLVYPMKRVFTNFRSIRLPGAGDVFMLEDYSDFLAARDGLVLIDEMNLWLPARVWQAVPGAMLWKLGQVRKEGLDLWWTSQHPKRVDPVVRELTIQSAVVTSWFRLGFFWQRWYDGIAPAKGRSGFLTSSLVPFIPKIGRCYDHTERVSCASYVRGGIEEALTVEVDWESKRLQGTPPAKPTAPIATLEPQSADAQGQSGLQLAGPAEGGSP
jgi:hypothetical protein